MRTRLRRRNAPDGEVGPVVISRARIARRLRDLARRIARLYEGRELVVVAAMSGAMVFVCDLIRLLPIPVRVYMVGARSYRGKATRSGGLEFYLSLETSLRADGPSGRAGRRVPAGKLLRGCHVLVVDDLLDGGSTLAALLDQAAAQVPASLRSCVLFSKSPATRHVCESASSGAVPGAVACVAVGRKPRLPPSVVPRGLPQTPRQATAPTPRPVPDFVGFQIGPQFVVGYGLDFDGRYRNLPDLRLLKPGAGAYRGAPP